MKTNKEVAEDIILKFRADEGIDVNMLLTNYNQNLLINKIVKVLTEKDKFYFNESGSDKITKEELEFLYNK